MARLTIIELGTGLEEEIRTDLDDFRDLDDDYAAYAFDPDEVFDGEEAVAAEPNDWLADKLSREERALQKAAELIGKANWPLSTLSLVQQIFVMSGWGQTRLALEREIEKGLVPQELILAAHIHSLVTLTGQAGSQVPLLRYTSWVEHGRRGGVYARPSNRRP